jgi:transposase
MTRALALRNDFSAAELRKLAAKAKDASVSRRLLAIAAAYDGLSRAEAARMGGMDRQTLRDWVHRFNAAGPDGLSDRWGEGPEPKLSTAQRLELAKLVEAGPDVERGALVRWRCSDLKDEIVARFGVVYSIRSVSRVLAELGFAHVSARPRHPRQDGETVEAYKKLLCHAGGPHSSLAQGQTRRDLVSGRSQDWTEELTGTSMGAQRHQTPSAQGPALRQCLSVRRHLPSPGQGCRPDHARCQH